MAYYDPYEELDAIMEIDEDEFAHLDAGADDDDYAPLIHVAEINTDVGWQEVCSECFVNLMGKRDPVSEVLEHELEADRHYCLPGQQSTNGEMLRDLIARL